MSEDEKRIVERFLRAAEERYYTHAGHVPRCVTRTTIGWLRNLPEMEDFTLSAPLPVAEPLAQLEVIC